MGLSAYLPSAQQVSRQAVTILACAILIGFVLHRFPLLKSYVDKD